MKKLEKRLRSKHHIVKVVAVNYGRFSDKILDETILRNTEETIDKIKEMVKWCNANYLVHEYRIVSLRRCRGGYEKNEVVLGRLDITAAT